ncbi:disintegrin and metalloproteinase domain-containing protein 5-like [Talpa occidentalis]|uniref:disintegrin and metalloproteinase domain-containing protein 5-like n=1 Tax=Talpa occidentalis TaxID=50954 RepID=UPI00188DED1A|nr:disintegrin and metalloproteinase domain-containing protein 5-like [Talpa occidentalis]
MFLLLILLTGLGRLHADTKPNKKYLQMTLPEKISSSDTKGDPEKNIAYTIEIEGKPYFVYLKKQSFFSSASVVYSYDKDDTQHSKPLLVQMDCNYHGYIAGFPNSLVSLNTCSGLRGTMQFKNISYGIEPMEAVSGFMHMIYEEKKDKIKIPLLGGNVTYSRNDLMYDVITSIERTDFSKLFLRYLEMYIIVDKKLFDYMGSDIKIVTQKVVQIIGLVNTMLAKLKISILISSIEIWSNKNKISTTGNPNHILFRFVEWKRSHLFGSHQVAYLLAFKENPSFIGSTFPGEVCNKDSAAGVAVYPEGLSLESYAVSIVQLLGLNLGLTYDNNDTTCYCSGDICIMSPEALYSGGVKDFSTCNFDDFYYFGSHRGFECLHKIPPNVPVYRTMNSICGNGILETGEQCDCGTIENCTHKSCCDATVCALKNNAECGSGECCNKDCKVKPIGVMCRQSFDKECDFAEYCNGKSSVCVPDTYVLNGIRCDSGDSFCYEGRCRIFNKQCKRLIGRASRGASFACFEEINSRGDRYGNCGSRPCRFENVLCGKLACVWPHKTLVFRANLSVIYTHVREDLCVSTFRISESLPRPTITTIETPEERDDTFVEDGTVCGPEMFCVKFRCVEVQYQPYYEECTTSITCSNHGICNNFKHCHCEQGYAPPLCEQSAGGFGSIDDGHFVLTSKNLMEKRYKTLPKHRFLLIFYIFLPVLLITVAILIKRNKLRKLCYRKETESERSMSEESSSDSKLSSSVSNSL